MDNVFREKITALMLESPAVYLLAYFVPQSTYIGHFTIIFWDLIVNQYTYILPSTVWPQWVLDSTVILVFASLTMVESPAVLQINRK